MSRTATLLTALLASGCTVLAPFGQLTTGDAGADAGALPDGGADAGTGGMKLVFLSSEGYNGNLADIAGADARCAALAGAAGHGSDFVAWLSVPGDSVGDRLDRTAGPYLRVDGALVAANWEDLTNGVLANRIDLDENGVRIDDGGLVWTGTTHEGRAIEGPDGSCESWTNGVFGTNGGTGAYDDDGFGQWSFFTGIGDSWPCENRFHLYCFQR